jgi:hypothetical protein
LTTAKNLCRSGLLALEEKFFAFSFIVRAVFLISIELFSGGWSFAI